MITKSLVFDVEANGLLDEISEVWCMAGVCVEDGTESFLDRQDLSRESILEFFKGYSTIIGHNIIGYDIPLIKKMYNLNLHDLYDPIDIIDTYIWSRVLNPDRELPPGCPTSIKNNITKKSKRIGPHSLEAHAFSLGKAKISIDDWSVYDSSIITRCLVDIKINLEVFNKLLKECAV